MITSRQNRKLKDIRRLRRRQAAQALLEGPHLVAEAVAAGVPLRLVLATPEIAGSASGRALLDRAGCPVEEVAPEVLRELTDADAPQGVLAVAELPRGGVATLPRRQGGVYLFLDGVQDPGNLGALARVAEAAGGAGIACGPGTAHPNHPRALRGSAGSLLRLPVAWPVAAAELAEHLDPLATRWVSLVAHGGRDLFATALEGPLVLALGAEGPGLSPQVQQRAELAVRIPLAPPVESLNVATAAAVVLFELVRRRAEGASSPPSPRERRR